MLKQSLEYTDMNNLIIYGGSFNPPTIGHQEVVNLASNHGEVILCPTVKHAYNKNLIDIVYREIILRKAFPFNEIKPMGMYMYDFLVTFFKEQNPFILVGSDITDDIKNWKNGQELIEKYHFLVVLRNETKPIELKNYTVIGKIESDISSSKFKKEKDYTIIPENIREEVRKYYE